VVVGRERAVAAQMALRQLQARTFVLDDGFQHWALERDLDIVVVDACQPFGNGCLLPRGPLREPKAALERAGLVWLSKVEQVSEQELARVVAEVRALTPAPLVQAAYRVADILDDAGKSLGPSALASRRFWMLAGIARPGSFRRTLEGLGAEIVGEAVFADHRWFTPMEIEEVKLRARYAGVDAIAMTEKDALRLPDSAARGPFAVVRIVVDIRAGLDALEIALAGD
jgi:tetraacyldisaccharide 4'-kinase